MMLRLSRAAHWHCPNADYSNLDAETAEYVALRFQRDESGVAERPLWYRNGIHPGSVLPIQIVFIIALFDTTRTNDCVHELQKFI